MKLSKSGLAWFHSGIINLSCSRVLLRVTSIATPSSILAIILAQAVFRTRLHERERRLGAGTKCVVLNTLLAYSFMCT